MECLFYQSLSKSAVTWCPSSYRLSMW